MGRAILGVLAGILVSVGVVMGIEAVSHSLYPPPPGLDASRIADMKTLVDSMPLPAKLLVVIGWFLGTLAGGVAGNRIARAGWPAWVVALLGISGGIWTIVVIPHPLFMQIGAVLAPALAAVIAVRATAGAASAAPARA